MAAMIILPFVKFSMFVILFVLIGKCSSVAANFDDNDQWLSNSMEILRERRAEMEKGRALELDPRLVSAEKNRRVITVRKDGSRDFSTVTAAVASVTPGNSRRIIIRIGKGVYKEKLTVPWNKRYITFYGESADEANMPVISYGGTAAAYHGTMYSATVAVESSHFMAVNMIFENSAPKPAAGTKNSQAVALRISGDNAAFYNCRFLGYQDTLYDHQGKHFFYGCYIRGTVDFIFGNGRSIYMNSKLHSVATGPTAITAQGRTSVADKSGFSFVKCTVDGVGKPGTAVLSRAWRPRAMVVFTFSYLGSFISPSGWDDMGHKDRDETVVYREYKCSGPGAITNDRVGYGRILNEKQAQNYYSPNFIKAKSWLLAPPKI